MTVPYNPEQVPAGPRQDLLDRIAPGSRVLDVGCWSGFNGRYLIDVRSVEVDGIEPDGGMAELAARDYRSVVHGTVEEALGGDGLDPDGYDVILFLDVLEHLVDPGPVLRAMAQRLRPGGRILASIPNTAHWSLRRELLMGRWNYADSGLLDRTHVRFFTLDTMRELFASAGLRITFEDYGIDRAPLLRSGPRQRRHLRRWPRLFAVQIMFEVVPAAQA